MKIHAYGQYVSYAEKDIHTYLKGKMAHHTLCGYLFDNSAKNKNRLKQKAEDITCTYCLNKIKKLTNAS